jgi:uncharacterized protein YcbK (DUF882 family)
VRLLAASAILAFGSLSLAPAQAEDRALKLFNTHTNEKAVIVFKRDGVYDPKGLAQMNEILRDWRRDQPTRMDPQLLDLIWTVYRQTGSKDYIHIVCGYRSPETNGMLRRRSKAVAKNSQHMRGKAMDFFIPDVPLSKLREIGLRMQAGGVGFYPTSGSPFVHMDTGSVRMWPRMTREQLVRVFPNGKTLHVPSDGKPLPGYAEALAAYQARKGSAATAVASLDTSAEPASRAGRTAGEPIVLASGGDDGEDDWIVDSKPRPDAFARARPVTLAADTAGAGDVPLPRPSPRARDQVADGAFEAPAPLPEPISTDGPVVLASIAPLDTDPASRFEFDAPSHWNSPKAPAALTRAMAARDISHGTSVPIPPTAVVETIDVSRPLRAEAMTTAVLRGSTSIRDVAPVLAYAAPPLESVLRKPVQQPRVTDAGIPLPVSNPLRSLPAEPTLMTASIPPLTSHRMAPSDLTLTALDTQGLRIWIGTQSTRQKAYALLTMPDFSNQPSLLEKPDLAFAAGFSDSAYRGLRTDRFSGPMVQPPLLVDLTTATAYALR